MSKPWTFVDTAEQISDLVKELRKTKIFAYDTEFIRETTFYPQLEIIQLGTHDHIWIVDARKFIRSPKGPEDLKPLLEILVDPSILKIVHAAQGDQEAMVTNLGVLPTPIFDTACGASLLGYGEAIGLAALVRDEMKQHLKKGHARTHWGKRPLPDQLLEYAAADVLYLVELAEKLFKKLDAKGRKDWAFELSQKFEEPKLFESNPVDIAIKMSRGGKVDKETYAILVEILRWREERVRDANLPRKWIAEDSVCVDLARVHPEDLEHLEHFRGLSKGELKVSASRILEAIRTGKRNQLSPEGWVEVERLRQIGIPSEEESRACDLIKVFVGRIADREKVALRHLMAGDDSLRLLRDGPEGVLSKRAFGVIGEELKGLLSGNIALRIGPNGVEGVKV